MMPLASIGQLMPGMSTGALGPAQPVLPDATSIPAEELRALDASQPGAASASTAPADTSFSSLLEGMVQDVNAKQGAAAQALQDLQSGRNVSLHQAMISTEEASISFQLMVEVRNRLMDSYQEIMRMQV